MGEAREAQEGGDVCIVKADSHCCMAETNTTLEGNYPPIKKKKRILQLQVPVSQACFPLGCRGLVRLCGGARKAEDTS